MSGIDDPGEQLDVGRDPRWRSPPRVRLVLALVLGVLAATLVYVITRPGHPGTQAAPGSTSASRSPSATHSSSSSALSPRVFGPPGSAGNPLVLPCDARFGPSLWFHPRPGDLVIGALDLAAGKAVGTMTPAEYGYSNYGHRGRFYKMGLALARGATATVTIAPPGRGHVVMATGSASGVTSATYHSCPHQAVGFAQGFAFTRRPFRGCVPLDVTIGDRPPVHHVTLSLFAGTCTTDPAARPTASW